MNISLVDKIALVTGGSRGIGQAAAMAFSQQGAKVAIVARNPADLKSTASEIFSLTGNEVLQIQSDVRDPMSAQRCVSKVVDEWGAVDILVNNSGGPPPKGFLEASSDDWENALQLNLLSCIRFTTAVAPLMMERKWGRIITVGSTLMKEPSAQMVLSAAARAGSVAFLKAVSLELAPHGVTVNSIATGGVETQRLYSLFKTIADKEGKDVHEAIESAASGIPVGRFASPEEFVQIMVFLASEASSYVTGTCVAVDGGLSKGAF